MALRETVLDKVHTLLSGITVAGGYNTTVVTVEQKIRHFECVGKSEMPYIGIAIVREDYVYDQGKQERVNALMEFLCYAEATTHAAGIAAMSNLRDDIRDVLMATSSLGVDGVIELRLVGTRSAEADPEAIIEGIAAMVIEARVRWEENF